MAKTGEQFIHSKDADLHHSQEVETVVSFLRAGGEKIPNDPVVKIRAYIGFLANKEAVNDGILTGNEASIARQVDALVITPNDVPESYFDLQRRIAREQGHGDITITPDMRRQWTDALRADQRASLNKWAEYIGGPDGTYPAWFEYYVWESLQKLGQFDKAKGEFTKRTKSTAAPYPVLNREALAYVYDKLAKSLDGDIADEPEKLQKLLTGGNFGKLYAHALLEATSAKEIIKNIEGSWKKYDQTDDPRTSRRLSESLAGYDTGWCTAGQETAAIQLQGGDFYVYFSKDEKGNDTVPRVAIRMENDIVAEVRGILDDQELEPDFYEIVQEKLAGLPGGTEYAKKAEDMKRLTQIDNLLRDNPEAKLTQDDLRFIHEINGKIEGFGYGVDPRISEILRHRDFIVDMQTVFHTKNHTAIAERLIDVGWVGDVVYNLDKFTGLDHQAIAERLIDAGYGFEVAQNKDKFTGLKMNRRRN